MTILDFFSKVRRMLSLMSLQTKLSIKGQVVMEAATSAPAKINYEEYLRRIPKYGSPAVSISDINAAMDEIFIQKYRHI